MTGGHKIQRREFIVLCSLFIVTLGQEQLQLFQGKIRTAFHTILKYLVTVLLDKENCSGLSWKELN